MSWVALVLAVLALPVVLIDRRWALVLVVAAGAVALRNRLTDRGPRVATVALLIAALAAALIGWVSHELQRPPAPAAIDPAPYQRPGRSREVILPLRVQVADVTGLAVLEFAPGADETYVGLELQWIEGDQQGWRVIAYRQDGYVDFYDDHALGIDPTLRSQVTGRGLRDHVNVDLTGAVLERDDRGRAHIEFAFIDTAGRPIEVAIHETTSRKSVPTTLLAPVGSGSTDPDYFPLFILNEFEFIRLHGSRLDTAIDGRPIELAPFPVPLPIQGQRRSFAKYSPEAEIITLFDTTEQNLRTVSTRPGSDTYVEDGVAYVFADDALERIRVNNTEIAFSPPLGLRNAQEGRITVTSFPEHGTIGAAYRVRPADDARVELTIDIDRVTVPRQRDPLYRLIVNERTVFGTWPTQYRYRALVDVTEGRIDARWTN